MKDAYISSVLEIYTDHFFIAGTRSAVHALLAIVYNTVVILIPNVYRRNQNQFLVNSGRGDNFRDILVDFNYFITQNLIEISCNSTSDILVDFNCLYNSKFS